MSSYRNLYPSSAIDISHMEEIVKKYEQIIFLVENRGSILIHKKLKSSNILVLRDSLYINQNKVTRNCLYFMCNEHEVESSYCRRVTLLSRIKYFMLCFYIFIV